MKKLIAFLFVSLLWSSNANAAKGDGICGLASVFEVSEAEVSIKVAAYVKVKDTDKENCKKIIKILSGVQKGNNKFKELVKNIVTEAKFKSDIVVDVSKFRMNWMQDCGRSTYGLDGIAESGDVCAAMEPYKLYLFANYDKTAVTKTLFDKNLDNDAAFEEVANLLK